MKLNLINKTSITAVLSVLFFGAGWVTGKMDPQVAMVGIMSALQALFQRQATQKAIDATNSKP